MDNLRRVFIAQGQDVFTAAQRAYATAFGLRERQAAMLSFTEAFWLLGIMFLAIIPLVFLLRRPRDHTEVIAGH